MQGQKGAMNEQRRFGYTPAGNQTLAVHRQRKKIILCFDGTGNKFQGTSADSNILKIYGMLDRDNGDKHYYQPGIGTYVNSSSLSHTSRIARLNSWYRKAKDSAVGTSFDQHVMGAYKFLMQCYNDDDIYIFGFSRGAYVARFLAEMLDHVGLLSAGNEEMTRFAWKAFAQWQEREDNTDEEKKEKKEMLEYLQAFRETFSRPVRRIRFLGLFDTVNSVPRFENAWMKRTKFPYTARSTAKVIRHAVSIDERRAKFRSDLISESKPSRPSRKHHYHRHRKGHKADGDESRPTRVEKIDSGSHDRFRRKSRVRAPMAEENSAQQPRDIHESHLNPQRNTNTPLRSASRPRKGSQDLDASSIASGISTVSFQPGNHPDDDDDADEKDAQDIEELWFPGCHADLGGGWPLGDGEDSALSHSPLVWMVREAQLAGIEFDPEKMLKFNCCDDDFNIPSYGLTGAMQAPPDIKIDSTYAEERPDLFRSPKSEKEQSGWIAGLEPHKPTQSEFHKKLLASPTKGVLHDCLEFNNGLGISSVLSWKMMEYLPFRRMDLRPDGSWKAISFPLPMGEVRDIPENARIHHSAIRRMEAKEDYRPGNLIIGGGGRGVRKAPKEMGIGQWRVFKEEGNAVGMTYVRATSSNEKKVLEERVGGNGKVEKSEMSANGQSTSNK